MAAKKLLNQQGRIEEARKQWEKAKVQTNVVASELETYQNNFRIAKEQEYEKLNIYLAELEFYAAEIK